MKIHAVYSQPHYLEHILAIHRHLPEELQGQIIRSQSNIKNLPSNDLILIAGYSDLAMVKNNRVVLIEHGAGQRYVDLEEGVRPFYGGPYPERVVGYIGPRQEVVDDLDIPGSASGSPVCDPYELIGEDFVCAITWHWNARRVCPEARSALDHYVSRLPEIVGALRDQGWEVLGHRHPRLRGRANIWGNIGVEEVDVSTVRSRASLLIADNTSLAYEMAYLCRQNITLNAPWYRPDTEHGLRFWENPPGAQVDNPDELIDMICNIDKHLPRTYSTRAAQAAYDKVYNDGNDGMRAAAWLTCLASSM